MCVELRDRDGLSPPEDVDDLIEYAKVEFGDEAIQELHKGENSGWYLDKKLISILVSDWTRHHGADRVKLVPRDTKRDRSFIMSLQFKKVLQVNENKAFGVRKPTPRQAT